MASEGKATQTSSELTLSSASWGSLPFELLQEIVTYAAHNDRAFAATLCRTSTAFNAWTTPILYRVLKLTPSTMRPWFLNVDGLPSNYTLVPPQPTGWSSTPREPAYPIRVLPATLDGEKLSKYGHFVEFLRIQYQNISVGVELLKFCKNLRDLSLWTMPGDDTSALIRALNDLPHLARLAIDPEQDPRDHDALLPSVLVDPSHTFIRNLTHLEFNHTPSFIGNANREACKGLSPARMPRLTHLGLNGVAIPTGLLPSIVDACPQLRIIAVWSYPSRNPGARIPGAEQTPIDKVVFMKKEGDLIEEWERAALEGKGYWELAELALEQGTHREPPRYYT